jgi:hypothetical protein
MYQNGNLFFTVADSAQTSGKAGALNVPPATITNSQISAALGGGLLYFISGNAGVAGATVSYTGTASGSVTADSLGNYVIAALVDAGSYTITPSKAGYSFSPVNSAQTISSANISAVNFVATQLQLATPSISPNGGRVLFPVTITLSDSDSAQAGFAMYYTTDGSIPTSGSTLYSAPFSLNAPAVVKVLAVATGYIDSAIASASFTSKSGDFDFRLNFRY